MHRVSAAKNQILPLWVHDTNLYLVYSTYFIFKHCITNLACRFVPTFINIDQHCTQSWRQFCILPVTFLFTQAGSVLRRAALFLAPRPFGGGLNDTLLARLRQVRSRCRNRLRLRVICFIPWSVDLFSLILSSLFVSPFLQGRCECFLVSHCSFGICNKVPTITTVVFQSLGSTLSIVVVVVVVVIVVVVVVVVVAVVVVVVVAVECETFPFLLADQYSPQEADQSFRASPT